MENPLSGISQAKLKSMTTDQLSQLCMEIRRKLIATVAQNGGHLSSNLGAVELTVALHRVFTLPQDSIVWDVGHQGYTHKLLTGRCDALSTLRRKGGISGFPNRLESDCDAFTVGHSSTSISAALGIAKGKELLHEAGKTIAVIGDGALTGGMAYEGLNNAGQGCKNLIVILNDNTMSISQNVGSITGHLSKLRTTRLYLKAKDDVEYALSELPVVGDALFLAMKRSKRALKKALAGTTLFEDLGFAYYGPINGHNLPTLLHILERVKQMEKPVFLHVVTQKGRGYRFAERSPDVFHGVSAFDIRTGQGTPTVKSFSDVFGKALCNLAKEDDTLCAITAAMATGTSLTRFAALYPKRFFDVGIAEQHAVTFAGGLSTTGIKPVVAIYSTFLQRAYDQIIHDAALQRTKVVLAIDRAGVVGEDGETHQGVFDVAFLNMIPNVTLYTPAYYDELKDSLKKAIYDCPYVGAVRYPRGKSLYRPEDFMPNFAAFQVYGTEEADVCIVTYGRLFSHACLAKEALEQQGKTVKILKLNCVKPFPQEAVQVVQSCRLVAFFEEGMESGGIGETLSLALQQANYKGRYFLRGIGDRFVPHATVQETLEDLGLSPEKITQTMVALWEEN